jgi:uncharacterized protein with HEPN domain
MKDDRVYFEHILLCIEKIEDYTKMDRSLYMGSTIIQDAVVRNLQVLAESTQRISDRVKTNYPDTEWQAISGFRNILVHDYLGLDLKLIWSVVEKRLPPLRIEVDKMLEDAG